MTPPRDMPNLHRTMKRARSVLFSPATHKERAARLLESGADVVVLDLEDAVAPHFKDSARVDAVDLATSLVTSDATLQVFVRVNAANSTWFKDDVAFALADGLAGVVVPKVEVVDDLSALANLRRTRPELTLMAGIETALGVHNVDTLLGAGVFGAVYFGAEDFITDMGGVRTPIGLEVLFARSRVVLAARIAGLTAIDQVVTTINDGEAFLADASLGRQLGYAGKLCIHPSQVGPANSTFHPSAAELELATRIVAAVHDDEGGIALVDGEMIDAPMVRRARDLLSRADGELRS